MTTPLFDMSVSEDRKEKGIKRATTDKRKALLSEARDVVLELLKTKSPISADDVVRYYADRNIDLPKKLGNAMGGLFKGLGLVRVGFTKSERVKAHANLLSLWARKE